MIQKLWETHKRFLLVVGSGLVAFLILNGLLNSYLEGIDGPKGLYARIGAIEKEVRGLHKELNPLHGETRARLEELARHEDALRRDIELPAEPELERFDSVSPLVQFNQAIDRTWGDVLDRANRASIALPEKLGPESFGIDRRDGRAEYEAHYAYLGIVRRALAALVDAGVAEIQRPTIEDEDWLPILPGRQDVWCVLRSVRFRVTGSYDAFVRVLKSLQEPRRFLQASVRTLQRSPPPGDERILRGEIEFVGIRLVEGEGEGGPGPGGVAGKPRKRS